MFVNLRELLKRPWSWNWSTKTPQKTAGQPLLEDTMNDTSVEKTYHEVGKRVEVSVTMITEVDLLYAGQGGVGAVLALQLR
jgi:hypothetical protein